MKLFQTCTTLHLGSGCKALFWKDHWHNRVPLCQSFLELFNLADGKI
jgi:hypothetical protein